MTGHRTYEPKDPPQYLATFSLSGAGEMIGETKLFIMFMVFL